MKWTLQDSPLKHEVLQNILLRLLPGTSTPADWVVERAGMVAFLAEWPHLRPSAIPTQVAVDQEGDVMRTEREQGEGTRTTRTARVRHLVTVLKAGTISPAERDELLLMIVEESRVEQRVAEQGRGRSA